MFGYFLLVFSLYVIYLSIRDQNKEYLKVIPGYNLFNLVLEKAKP